MNTNLTYKKLEKRIEELENELLKLRDKEKDLRESEKMHRELIHHANSIIFQMDREGNITFINEFALNFFGYKEDEIIGRNLVGTLIPEKDTSGRDLKAMIKNLLCNPDQYTTNENENIKKNGERVWIVWTNKAFYDKDGELEKILSIGNDNTKRKRAEEAQKEIENLFNSFMKYMPVLAFMKDRNGRYIYFNEACKQFYGVEPAERIGKTDDELFPFETAKKFKENDRKVMRERKIFRDVETIMVGEERQYHHVSKFPIFKNGEPHFLAGIALDITDRILAQEQKKGLEEQLLSAQRLEAIGTLSGGIAHNFNNLLMGIQGNAALAKMDIEPDSQINEKLGNIEKLVKRGATLTKQLLDYAQIGRHETKPININEIIKKTSNTFGETRKDIVIHQDLSRGLFDISADKGQIEQVLMNFYINASDAMPEGGELFLKTMNVTNKDLKDKPYKFIPGNYVFLEIRDTGIGMDKETMNHIFEPFFTSKGIGSATGLGLSSVYGIIKGYGGYIHVHSEKGQGTTFEIYLPASYKEIVTDERNIHVQFSENKKTILFIDDEEMVLEVGEEILKKLDYKVLTAKSGKEAIEIYRQNFSKIDMVILDMIMPEMSGGIIFNKIREINNHARVLLSSGYSIDGRATEILKRGCDGFIQKPFSLENLSHKIREILGR